MKTITKKTTHIAKIRQRNATQLDSVCELLGWTRMQFCNHQFDEYTDFITRMFIGWPVMMHQVMHSPIMRGFWNSECALRNEEDFLPFASESIREIYEVDPNGELVILAGLEFGDAYLIEEYLFIHGHMRLVNDEFFMAKYNNLLGLIRKERYEH